MDARDFRQVDVFGAEPLRGNPVAVVHDATGLADDELQRFARWTNLSETTFLLPPTDPAADYRVRIFTPAEELPFAGHPTLGTAHAWLEAGGRPARDDVVVQECGVGLVDVRRGERLAFAAPDLLRSGPPDDATLAQAVAALGVPREQVLRAAWIDNGPGWLGVHLPDAEAVLALRPDFVAMQGLELGVLGTHEGGGPADVEVRAFCPGFSVPEDPVTGSLNAGFAVWLQREGVLPASYVARQGTAMGRDGRVHVELDADGTTWVGGATETVLHGTAAL
ncbi:PhzF family phenazine biosynthesis protein [Nocardioides aequoreus]|uniref:PhzF family phenazine biosynthesis protein n=1 Tax=Nocardioides aequoreus TaxID=397278 RepID=UPI0004C2C067|nr:PhzF family phenazine biosynthesis protein [Nocardioides aequoreus]